MARYSPGGWFAIVTPGGVALLPPAVPAETVERVWTALRAGEGLGAVIEGLVGAFGTSLSLLPDFAVLVTSGADVRVAVRGGATARLRTAGNDPVEFAGTGVTTWSEQALTHVTSAVLAAPDAQSGADLPVADGIVLAGRIEVVALEAAVAEPEASPVEGSAQPIPEPVGSSSPARTIPEPVGGSSEPQAPSPDPEAPDEVESSGPAETTWVEPADEAAHDFAELLFGETVLSSVEAAAVREPAPESTVAPTPSPPATAAPATPAPPAPSPVAPAGATPAAPSIPPGQPSFQPPAAMIQGVPFATPTPPPAGDHDGQTVLVDDLRAMVSVGQSQPTTPLTPNPPVLLAPGVGRVILDRSAIVGTRPQLSRVQGSNVPHLVTVTSPSGEISRNHLELRVEGTNVLAVDLNSTNGTLLLRAGGDPIRLHPGEPSMLVAGDRIDLGDGVMLGFEGLR